jgi:hypothetical protein
MTIYIKNEETERLVTELAAEAGESKLATVRQALLAERLRREDLRRRWREELRQLLA